MKYFRILILIIFTASIILDCRTSNNFQFNIPSEFEEQEYIWLSWVESGFLSGEPFNTTILSAIKEITPYVKVRLFYGPQLTYDNAQMKNRIFEKLIENKIDTSRISLFYNEQYYGAIQDPGPIFLRSEKGQLAIADFKFIHPDKRAEEIDRNVANQLGLPTISSNMVSEGGAWQTNGEGTMLLVESVELDRNKNMNKKEIEAEYKRVLGVSKIIWLKKGLKEEEWGKLENGIYGIGTGGHIDEFCRFVDNKTVLLANINPEDTVENEIAKESFLRMEENYKILSTSTNQDGKQLKIIRIPAGPLMTKKVNYKNLNKEEQFWFDDVTSDSVAFYLATGYLNFIIANEVIVTAKFWKEGLPNELKYRDAQAKKVLENAFPGRKVVQIDCMPLHHDGAGLHCHSRNEPKIKRSDKAIDAIPSIGGTFENSEFTYYGIPKSISSTDTSSGWNLNGQKMLLTGIVYQIDGKTPQPDVLLYYYQTNTEGKYLHKAEESRSMPPNELGQTHGYIRGWVKTDAEGKYNIYTVRPGTYPTNDEPAHVHITVKEPNAINEYYIDDFVFDDDKLLTSAKRKNMENRCGSGVMRMVQKSQLQIGERNIILGLNIPDYPAVTNK